MFGVLALKPWYWHSGWGGAANPIYITACTHLTLVRALPLQTRATSPPCLRPTKIRRNLVTMVVNWKCKDVWAKNTLAGLGLGQLLSLLITSTGLASSDLAKKGSFSPVGTVALVSWSKFGWAFSLSVVVLYFTLSIVDFLCFGFDMLFLSRFIWNSVQYCRISMTLYVYLG